MKADKKKSSARVAHGTAHDAARGLAHAVPKAAPRVIVNAHAVARLRSGHPWIFKSDIERLDEAAPGALVRVEDQRGRPYGSALYSSASQIALRMVAPNPVETEKYPELLRYRIRQAIADRQRVVRDSGAFRVLFSEADITPGLIVDKYNDVLSCQLLTQAMDAEWARELLIEELQNADL